MPMCGVGIEESIGGTDVELDKVLQYTASGQKCRGKRIFSRWIPVKNMNPKTTKARKP